MIAFLSMNCGGSELNCLSIEKRVNCTNSCVCVISTILLSFQKQTFDTKCLINIAYDAKSKFWRNMFKIILG